MLSAQRRLGVLGIAFTGIFVGLQPAAAVAQAVSLPSIRTTGPSPIILLLQSRVVRLRTIEASDSSNERMIAKLDTALTRLSLAPFTERDLKQLHSSTVSVGAKDSILYQYLPEYEVQQNREKYLRALANTRPSARSQELTDDVNEYETGELIRRVRLLEDDPAILAQLDTLSMVARAAVLERKLRTRVWFPVRSHEQAAMFWGQSGVSILNIGFIAGTGSQGVAYTELASPLLHFVRISVNSVLAAANEERGGPAGGSEEGADEATMMRFINGGGTLNVAFAAPIAHLSIAQGNAQAMLLAHPRFGGTTPALGASERDSTLVYDLGMELHLLAVDAVGGVGLFLQIRGAMAGGTGRFGELLGTDANHFPYAALTTGLSLGNRYLINVGRTLTGPRALRDRGWQLGITALRRPERTPGR